MAYTHGKFVWFELLTAEIEGAKAFYGEVLGWGSSAQDMGDFKYTMLLKGQAPSAGVLEPPQSGIPAHWTSYVSVDDVDAGAKLVEKHGGKVLVPPTDIPGIGRFSLVADPEGASFNLFKGESSDDNATTAFHWNELWARDAEAVLPFYEKVLGVTVEAKEMPRGTYHVLMSGDLMLGGVMTSPRDDVPPMWLPYIEVDDCDATVGRVKNNGGKVHADPMDVEGVGRFSVVADPAGAVVGLIKPAPPSA